MTTYFRRLAGARYLLPLLILVLLIATGAGCGAGKDKDAPPPARGAQAGKAGQGKKPGGGDRKGRPGNPGQHAGAGRDAGPSGRGDVQPVPVSVVASARGPIATYFHATATLEAEKQAQVLARVTGVIAELRCEEGDEVAEGQPLLVIGNPEYRYKVQQAEAKVANLQARFDRLDAMRDEDLITEEEFGAARSELESALADKGLAEMNLSYTTVRAPFAGRVTERLVDVGQTVSINSTLVTVADFHPLLARVHVPSREFNRLQQNQEVELDLDSTGEAITGRIKLISPVIDPATGTIKLTIEVLDYPAGTRPGDFAEVRIVTEERPAALLVPRAAVVTDQGESVVYLVTAGTGDHGPRIAERRVVELGFTDDDNAEILAGLREGEEVVVRGQRSLKHGMPVRVLDDDGAAVAGS